MKNPVKKAFMRTLHALGIRFVRILWCDNGNVIRSKAVHRDALESFFESGVGISEAQQSVPVMYDAVSKGSGLGPVGEVRLVPDWNSFNLLPYAPGHARVMGDMIRRGEPWSRCPREYLRRMIREASREGFELRTAFENEFYLLKPGEGICPVDETHFAVTYSMDINRKVMSEICESLERQGMRIMQYYAESGPGQQEISIGHTDPMEAADNQVAFRETVHAVAHHNGLKASFLPGIFPDKSGSGSHLHISLWKDGKNLTPDPAGAWELGSATRSFIAGILHHLPALMAVTTPTINSLRRIRPHYWCGAYCCWGIDNREAAVRVLTEDVSGLPDHFEFKTLDATANPYLAMGAVISAGLDGVRQNREPSSPMGMDPGDLTDGERDQLGIKPLPNLVSMTLEAFRDNPVLPVSMGQDLAQAYQAVKSAEFEYFRSLDFESEVGSLLEKY